MSAQDFPMLIDGKLTAAAEGEWMESVNPADEQVIGRVPVARAVDVDRAVTAAARAQPAWSRLPVVERARLLRQVAQELRKRQDEILKLEVQDTGNTIGKMRNDLGGAIDLLDYYCGLGLEVKGETVPVAADSLHFTTREPYGVVARIAPFNHPIYYAVTSLAGPLVTGNTVVIKSPDPSPLSSVYLAEATMAVLPPGVVNVVSGPGIVTGDALVRHKAVRRIAFTGSVKTGLAIQRAAAEVCVKNVSLELGGKNPMIVFPDMDPEVAAEAAVAGMNFAWQGQSCGSTSRVMVHESIYDAVVQSIEARVSGIKLGNPLDEKSQMGPVNSQGHYERVCYYAGSGREDGAKLVTGGKRPAGAQFQKGYWLEPTVFADVTMDMRVGREEIFGPVLSVMRWKHVDEVVAMANDIEFGLTAALWTQDLKLALNVARRIDCGYVWINKPGTHFLGLPFGGSKNSGNGREECLEELMSYTQPKAFHVSLK